MHLTEELISGGLTRIEEIAAYLDGLPPDRRLAELRALPANAMAVLWARAADSPPVTESHFVPEGTPAVTEVVHDGWNSLPAFRGFQKRFCRTAEEGTGAPIVAGYNHNPVLLKALTISPGYFVLRPTAGLGHWERRGAWVVDYHLVPRGPVAPGWPRVVPNHVGLQRFVFDKTRDFMRRVSAHVSIGSAWKWEKALGVYFVLCRQD